MLGRQKSQIKDTLTWDLQVTCLTQLTQVELGEHLCVEAPRLNSQPIQLPLLVLHMLGWRKVRGNSIRIHPGCAVPASLCGLVPAHGPQHYSAIHTWLTMYM
jgi:hypothetical protein